jgi:hypothetical protein
MGEVTVTGSSNNLCVDGSKFASTITESDNLRGAHEGEIYVEASLIDT